MGRQSEGGAGLGPAPQGQVAWLAGTGSQAGPAQTTNTAILLSPTQFVSPARTDRNLRLCLA